MIKKTNTTEILFDHCSSKIEADNGDVKMKAEGFLSNYAFPLILWSRIAFSDRVFFAVNAGMKMVDERPETFNKTMKPQLEKEINRMCNYLIKTDVLDEFDNGNMLSFVQDLMGFMPIRRNVA